ncbi:MAG: cell division protein FtsH, partial [Chloroflexi bacterium]|nr:cell division protein FtsH [Chloroflexota bacterium]
EFTEAIERVALGPERRSRVISPEEKRIVAYHEAGHAVVTHICEHAPPVHKISIIPRGQAGGYVLSLPEEDRMFMRESEFMDRITVALGGRAAEEVVFGDMTDGAASDLEHATRMARAMVTRYGMSKKLGPMVFGKRDELIFLGKEIGEQRNYSEEVAQMIDEEIQRIITEAYTRAKDILIRYRHKLDQIAQLLIEKETLEREEFEALFQDESVDAEEVSLSPAPA